VYGVPICIGDLSATGVAGRNEGKFGTTDPMLWVFERRGDYDTMQKTGVQMDTLTPRWTETICFGAISGAGIGDWPCFEIRDDYDPNLPPDRPPLLHAGCVSGENLYMGGQYTIGLSNSAHVSFTVSQQSPAPPPTDIVVDRINDRFRHGAITNDLEAAGVLLHQFDAMDDDRPENKPWMPGMQHEDTGDRISAALVNAHMLREPSNNIPVYSFSLAGIILNPAANRLLCAYPWDVGSLSRHCWPRGVSEKCIPGCSRFVGDGDQWCKAGTEEWKFRDPACAWRPDDLREMMRVREEVRANNLRPPQKMWNDNKYYSELIFDAAFYTQHLPHSIEAVFYLDDDCGDAFDGPKCREYGIAAHRAIVSHFGLDAKAMPLLKLDLWNWQAPFSDVSPV